VYVRAVAKLLINASPQLGIIHQAGRAVCGEGMRRNVINLLEQGASVGWPARAKARDRLDRLQRIHEGLHGVFSREA
jgi:hypothetical protein